MSTRQALLNEGLGQSVLVCTRVAELAALVRFPPLLTAPLNDVLPLIHHAGSLSWPAVGSKLVKCVYRIYMTCTLGHLQTWLYENLKLRISVCVRGKGGGNKL